VEIETVGAVFILLLTYHKTQVFSTRKEKVDMYYTCKEVAEILKLSLETIWDWIRAGKLPATKIGKSYRIPKEAVDQLLPSRKRPRKPQ